MTRTGDPMNRFQLVLAIGWNGTETKIIKDCCLSLWLEHKHHIKNRYMHHCSGLSASTYSLHVGFLCNTPYNNIKILLINHKEYTPVVWVWDFQLYLMVLNRLHRFRDIVTSEWVNRDYNSAIQNIWWECQYNVLGRDTLKVITNKQMCARENNDY